MPHARPGVIELRTLMDGGQTADQIAAEIVSFIAPARRTLDLALYDIRLPDPIGSIVETALLGAAERGVAVRIAYNLDHRNPIPVPPPPSTVPDLLEALPVPTCGIPGIPDLMHHKYVVRDGSAVWSGSTNWTLDSWQRQENVIVRAESAELAARFQEDFEQLWRTREVDKSGRVDPGDGEVRAWFCPGRGDRLAHRIAHALGCARRRIRVASPVITSGPILGTLAQVASDGRVDVGGVVDRTQVEDVLRQWAENGNAAWKTPALVAALTRAQFSGKPSTPYAPDSVHDYMHAKITVADDTVFVGSFNLSHSGELNAENVVEVDDPALADRMAAFVDRIRGRYPPVELQGPV